MALASFNTKIQEFALMQSSWSSTLNPLITKLSDVVNDDLFNPSLLSANLLTAVALKTGDNRVQHKLGKKLTGWIIIRKRANANIYDKQDSEPRKEVFLALNTSADVTVDLYVF